MDSPKVIDLGVVVSISDDGVATLLDLDGFTTTVERCTIPLSVGMKITMTPVEEEESAGRPERLALLAGFLVPPSVRLKCFEPFFEEMKEDRLEKIARTGSRGVKRWIEFCFYFRWAVTVLQSLVCYLGDLLAKLAPFIRALFFKGGS